MKLLQKIKKLIFTEPQYRYFKKVPKYYYGLCGTEVFVMRLQKNKGDFREIYDSFDAEALKRKGFKECTKQYYDKHNK